MQNLISLWYEYLFIIIAIHDMDYNSIISIGKLRVEIIVIIIRIVKLYQLLNNVIYSKLLQ